MNITEDYCSQDLYRLLRKKDYDGAIHTTYDEEGYTCPCITHQSAMKWLRDEKQIYVCPKLRCFFDGKRQYYKWEATILRLPSNNIIYPQPLDMCKHYESYPEAVEAALKYSLENLI